MLPPTYPIVVQTKEEQGLVSHVRLDRRLYLNAEKTKLVEEGDEDAAFLYGIEGQLRPKKEVEQYGASVGEEVTGDEAKDVIHVEVKTPNLIPGSPRVEGSGKATIPVTQADRAAVAGVGRSQVSGRGRKKTEGEAFLEGELEPLEDQETVGETATTKQIAADPGGKPLSEEERKAAEEAERKQARQPGNKQANKPADK